MPLGCMPKRIRNTAKLSVLCLYFLDKQLALNVLLFRIFFGKCKPMLELLDIILLPSTTFCVDFHEPGLA